MDIIGITWDRLPREVNKNTKNVVVYCYLKLPDRRAVHGIGPTRYTALLVALEKYHKVLQLTYT